MLMLLYHKTSFYSLFSVTHSDFKVERLAELSKDEVERAVTIIREEANLSLPIPKCDVCKKNPQAAKVWCKDCKKCICENHLEVC